MNVFLHEGHKDYKCTFCGKSFSYAHHLKRHTRTIHEGNKDYNYKCESCNKTFTGAQMLKMHIHTVHEDHKQET